MEEKKKTEQNTEQLNSFDQLLEKLAAAGGSIASSSELTKLIDNLVITREKMIKKEEEDRCKKEEIEAKRFCRLGSSPTFYSAKQYSQLYSYY